MNRIHKFIKKSWQEGTQIGRSNILTAVILGGGAHISLYFIYKYGFGLYENIYLRVLTSFLCISVGLYYYLPNRIKQIYFPFYWHLMLIMALPFVITVNLFKTNFNEAWLYWDIFVMFLLALYVPNWLIYTIDLVIGFGGALLFYIITTPNYSFDYNFNLWSYLLVFSFSGIAGMGFIYGNRAAWLEKQKAQYTELMSVAGSIAHEMRNPISAIRMSSQTLPNIKDLAQTNYLNQADIDSIVDHKDLVNKTCKLASEIIDMTLLQLSGRQIKQEDFIYIDAFEAIRDSINIYGYKSSEEREKIKLEINDKFIIKAIETTFKYILFNLIKNALYYVKDKPELTITISQSSAFGEDVLKDTKNSNHSDHLKLRLKSKYNIISITDTGPGIPSEILAKLFGSFVTAGKKEGTGLGLAFCKRTMLDFGGDIDCESKVGQYTKFNLYFPALNAEELKVAEEFLQRQNTERQASKLDEIKLSASNSSPDFSSFDLAKNSKKILIADDQEINLKISYKLIKELLPNSVIDFAKDGKEALELFKKNNKVRSQDLIKDLAKISDCNLIAQRLKDFKYDLIVTDIQMPNLDGFELAKEIRKLDKKVPICAYTSRVSYKVKQEAIDIGIDDYIIKPIPNRGMYKVIYKWLISGHNYNFDLDQVADKIKSLKVLIADDEIINIMVMKRFLGKYNLDIEAVNDGQSLVEKYKSQFDQAELKKFEDNNNPQHIDPTLINKYDIIIADINMPKLRGDEAAKQIRDFELIYSVQNKAIIIANSGDGQEEHLQAMLKSGMDDYFIKGQDNDKLLQIIYFWQNFYKSRVDPKYLNIDNKEHNQEDLKEDHPILNQKLSKEDLKELRNMFISSVKKLTKNIKVAVKNQDIEDLAFQSHALKGIAGNVGAQKLFVYISMINNHARKNHWPKEEDWLKRLEKIIKKTFEIFEGI